MKAQCCDATESALLLHVNAARYATSTSTHELVEHGDAMVVCAIDRKAHPRRNRRIGQLDVGPALVLIDAC